MSDKVRSFIAITKYPMGLTLSPHWAPSLFIRLSMIPPLRCQSGVSCNWTWRELLSHQRPLAKYMVQLVDHLLNLTTQVTWLFLYSDSTHPIQFTSKSIDSASQIHQFLPITTVAWWPASIPDPTNSLSTQQLESSLTNANPFMLFRCLLSNGLQFKIKIQGDRRNG